jgi:hypothetical protein
MLVGKEPGHRDAALLKFVRADQSLSWWQQEKDSEQTQCWFIF